LYESDHSDEMKKYDVEFLLVRKIRSILSMY